MKHIKKKFRFEAEATTEQLEQMGLEAFSIDDPNLKSYKVEKGTKCFVHSENNKTIEAFPIKINGSWYVIPEPDPVLIYFNNAYFNFVSIKGLRDDLLKSVGLGKKYYSESVNQKFYNYFGTCAGFATMLFTCIESFLNKLIPEDYEYKKVRSDKTELYSKRQIERYLSFDEKIKFVIKDITQKDFSHHSPNKFQHITNLKGFRDSIIHTKTSTDGHTPYDYLFKQSITFKYEDTIHCVRDFVNYYQENYIEECGCGRDF